MGQKVRFLVYILAHFAMAVETKIFLSKKKKTIMSEYRSPLVEPEPVPEPVKVTESPVPEKIAIRANRTKSSAIANQKMRFRQIQDSFIVLFPVHIRHTISGSVIRNADFRGLSQILNLDGHHLSSLGHLINTRSIRLRTTSMERSLPGWERFL